MPVVFLGWMRYGAEMEILIGLIVVTALLIGWGYGFWPVALFLTLGDLAGLAVIGLFRNPELPVYAVASVAIIWAPVVLKHFARKRRSVPNKPGQLLDLNLPPDRGQQIGEWIGFALTVGGVGWMYLHDISATGDLITSRPFLTAIGFAAFLGAGLGWANQAP